jgi:hypothetical protein
VAIVGIGARYGVHDVSGSFLRRNCACIKFDPGEADDAVALLQGLRTGDIVFMKVYGPRSKYLRIKGVGIVRGKARTYAGIGEGVPVDWLWDVQVYFPKPKDKSHHRRTGTIFEEHNPTVHRYVLDLLAGRTDRAAWPPKVSQRAAA